MNINVAIKIVNQLLIARQYRRQSQFKLRIIRTNKYLILTLMGLFRDALNNIRASIPAA